MVADINYAFSPGMTNDDHAHKNWFQKFHGGNKRLENKDGSLQDSVIKMRNCEH